jgi:predicted nucleic acid-binding protein
MELTNGLSIFMDTAPIIYFIEENPTYSSYVNSIFEKLSEGKIEVVTSVISYMEVLTKPYKLGKVELIETYKEFFCKSKGFSVININSTIAELAAKMRSKYSFKTPDAFQLAVFEYMGCDLFITNDGQLKLYDEGKVIVLSKI